LPTYDYRCNACGHAFELFQSMSAKHEKKCPKCGKNALERLIGTGAAVLFKGSGFYQTDYRSEGYKKSAEADKPASEAKSDSKGDGKSESKSDAKPETKPDTKVETKSESKPESKADSKPEPRSESRSSPVKIASSAKGEKAAKSPSRPPASAAKRSSKGR